MSGGDHARLMAAVWETPVLGALHHAFHFKGLAIHTLSSGHRYVADSRAVPSHWPAGLQAALQRLVKPGPVRC